MAELELREAKASGPPVTRSRKAVDQPVHCPSVTKPFSHGIHLSGSSWPQVGSGMWGTASRDGYGKGLSSEVPRVGVW